MKAKLLMTLFLVSLGFGAFASEQHKKRPRTHCKVQNRTVMTRVPFEPSIRTEDINDCLYLTFQFSLYDADITILDKDGNEVMHKQQTVIYEGRVVSIPEADGYPYSVEIKSPTVDVQGEIVLE